MIYFNLFQKKIKSKLLEIKNDKNKSNKNMSLNFIGFSKLMISRIESWL